MRFLSSNQYLHRKNFLLIGRAIISSVLVLIWTSLCSLMGLLTLLFSPSGRLYLSMARYWARVLLWICGVKIKQKKNFAPKRSQNYLYVCNHESVLDIAVLYAVLPNHVVMVAKRTLFYIPIFGWGMWLAGFIFVRRNNSQRDYHSLKKAVSHLKKSRSVLIFAEGTCNNGHSVLPFKKGAFFISQICQIPIVPIGISGVHGVLTPDHYLIFPGRVSICFGHPIKPPASEKEINSCRKQTRSSVIKLIKKSQTLNLLSLKREREAKQGMGWKTTVYR